jgi:hypothetical protein
MGRPGKNRVQIPEVRPNPLFNFFPRPIAESRGFPPVLRRSLFRNVFKEFIEVRGVIEAAFITHICDGVAFILQKLAGMADAQLVQKPGE